MMIDRAAGNEAEPEFDTDRHVSASDSNDQCFVSFFLLVVFNCCSVRLVAVRAVSCEEKFLYPLQFVTLLRN